MSTFLQNLIPENNRLNLPSGRNMLGAKAVALEAAYNAGFVGAFSDDAKVDCPEWAKRAGAYMDREFISDTPGRIKFFTDVAPGLASGDGEYHINTRHALDYWYKSGKKGVEPFTCDQDFGSCVDASDTEHETGFFGHRAAILVAGKEEYRHPAAWYKYADRGYCSDGWGGGGIATVARRVGCAFRVRYEIDGNVHDFTGDDENERIVAREWCSRGIPQYMRDFTSKNHGYEDGAITQFQDGGIAEIKKCLAAGGALHHSGTFTSGGPKPNTNGSTGSHMQSAINYDDSEFARKWYRDVHSFTIPADDYMLHSHQTWGSGWKGEVGDEYWPFGTDAAGKTYSMRDIKQMVSAGTFTPQFQATLIGWGYGWKPQGIWIMLARNLLRRVSMDYAWLPWAKGFPSTVPVPVNVPQIQGTVHAEVLPDGRRVVRGEPTLVLPDGTRYQYLIVPDGTGSFKHVPKQVV